MYDLENEPQDEQVLAKNTLGDKMGRALYDKFMNKTLDEVDMHRLILNYGDMIRENRESEYCLVMVRKQPKKGYYEITQIMLDADEKPMYKQQNVYFGRVTRCVKLADEVNAHLNGGDSFIINNPFR